MSYDEINIQAGEILRKIRNQRPLIHHITNYVVMNSTANVTLAIGASPIMAHAHGEMREMQIFSGALNLNIGTLDDYWIASMFIAGRMASERGTPIILDPVGSGATSIRTGATKKILDELDVTVVRGNASEIMSLSTSDVKIQGVDSLELVDNAKAGAQELAKELGLTVAITGKIDFITNGDISFAVENGDPMFSNVTGTGCAATTAISCFNAVESDPVLATTAALAYFGLAGEIASKNSDGPGSFQVALYDALYNLTPEDVSKGVKIVKV
jgi:hydroxyethylthiazole kinase